MPDLNLFGALLVVLILLLVGWGVAMLTLHLADRKAKQQRRREMEAVLAEQERKRRVMESYWQYPDKEDHRE